MQITLSSDGRRMAYPRGPRLGSNIWLVDHAGAGEPARVQALTGGTAVRSSPSVSPDGQWIAFVQVVNDEADVYRMPIGGGAPTRITSGGRVRPSTAIAWSPTGTQIAFVTGRTGAARVAVVAVDGGRVRSFEQTEVGNGIAWAPSTTIAYQRAGNRAIHLLDPSSGMERALVTDTAGFVHAPIYSPDATKVAVTWNRGAGTERVWVFHVPTSAGSPAHAESHPDIAYGPYAVGWSPDGRYVYADGLTAIYRIDTQKPGAPEPHLTPPFREFDCTLAGRHRPKAFVCAGEQSQSDVWIIENVSGRAP
jgi:Tol biopolymer transport system component